VIRSLPLLVCSSLRTSGRLISCPDVYVFWSRSYCSRTFSGAKIDLQSYIKLAFQGYCETISRTIRALLKLQLLLSLMACFVIHLLVANSGYILWLVSQVRMFNFLVSAVGVVCFIMAVSRSA
jgi:hypothetical protein